MNTQIILTETSAPHGGVQIYRADFRELPIDKIETELQESLQSYASVGYNSFTLHRMTGTISIQRIEVKTMKDVFITDMYGLLK